MDYAKVLDTIIKAPLWFFLAALLASGIPMLNLDMFVRAGVTDETKLLGLPLALYAIVFGSLFLTAAVARSIEPIKNSVSKIIDWIAWRTKLLTISAEARNLLALVEEDAMDRFFYDPRDRAITMLRDKGILEAELVSCTGEKWGRFELSYSYRRAYDRHRSIFRSGLKYSHDGSLQCRTIMERAERSASNRV
jgi:hypothetical protein